MSAYIAKLEESKKQEDNPIVCWIGDSGHRGTDVYWSEKMGQWVFVDLENRELRFADKIAVYRSEVDGDETGLNHADVLAVDFDGPGLWLIGMDADEDPAPERDDVELIWESGE